MSALAITRAVQALLQAAVPEALVELRPPRVPSDQGNGVVLYLFHDGSYDVEQTSGGSIRRHHQFLMRLLVLTTADDYEAELVLLGLHDRITQAFTATAAAREINGAVTNSTLRQRDGDHGTDPRYAKAWDGDDAPEWLSRWWTLDAEEALTMAWV